MKNLVFSGDYRPTSLLIGYTSIDANPKLFIPTPTGIANREGSIMKPDHIPKALAGIFIFLFSMVLIVACSPTRDADIDNDVPLVSIDGDTLSVAEWESDVNKLVARQVLLSEMLGDSPDRLFSDPEEASALSGELVVNLFTEAAIMRNILGSENISIAARDKLAAKEGMPSSVLEETNGEIDAVKNFIYVAEAEQAFLRWVEERDIPAPSMDGWREVYDFIFSNKETLDSVSCVRHILIRGDDTQGGSGVLEEARRRVVGGEDFGDVANEISEDPSTRDTGGDLGCHPKGFFASELEVFLDALEVGEISETLETQFGSHIFYVYSRGVPSLEEFVEENNSADNSMWTELLRDPVLVIGLAKRSAEKTLDISVNPDFGSWNSTDYFVEMKRKTPSLPTGS